MDDFNKNESESVAYKEKMPNRGVYTFFLVLGFVTGVLWGALSIRHYVSMNNCIRENDSYGAWEGAKKVRMFAIIGVVVNVVVLLFQFALLSSGSYR